MNKVVILMEIVAICDFPSFTKQLFCYQLEISHMIQEPTEVNQNTCRPHRPDLAMVHISFPIHEQSADQYLVIIAIASRLPHLILKMEIRALLKFNFFYVGNKNGRNLHYGFDLLHNVKSTVKISTNFVAFLENINFTKLNNAQLNCGV